MFAREQHLEFLWRYLLTEKQIRRSSVGKSFNSDTSIGLLCNSDTGIWSHDASKCLLLTLYNARETQAEKKILNLLRHRSREIGGIETVKSRQEDPTDAEIIFGNCDCKKLFCYKRRCGTGWDKSRIDWLMDLENLEQQDQLLYISHKRDNRTKFPKRSLPNQQGIDKSESRGIGCWSWLCHNCFASDTVSESLQVYKYQT